MGDTNLGTQSSIAKINLVIGQPYSVSAHVRNDSGVDGPAYIYFVCGTQVADITQTIVNGAGWTQIKLENVVCTGNTSFSLEIGGDEFTYYVDDVVLEEGTTAGPYFDGNSTGAAWSGTPHNSQSVLRVVEQGWNEIGNLRTFENAIARAGATPVEGMYAHLNDTDRLEFYNGSSWVSPFGTTLLTSTTFASTTAITFDNLFSSAYDNYQLVLRGTSASAFTQARLNLRLAGQNAGGTDYEDQQITASAASITTDRLLSQAQARIGNITTLGGALNLTIFNPAIAERTFGVGSSYHQGTVFLQQGFAHNVTTAYDGLRITFTSNSTGTVQIYGLRK
jgi:hypothetical protein